MSGPQVKIFHNPRCSKSRAALQILREAGVEPQVVEYLHTPPTAAELSRILGILGCGPRDVIRKGEKEYRDLHLDDPKLTAQQLIETMVQHPILIERPIAVKGDRAVVGRPPERVKELIAD